MIVNTITDLFEKFKISWSSTAVLTTTTPMIEKFLPVISQIVLIASIQLISLGVDYAREKIKLKRRSKEDLEIPNSFKDNFKDNLKN